MKFIASTGSLPMGLIRALLASGFEIQTWDRTRKPVFDLFAEHRFDYVVVKANEIDRALLKCLDGNPRVNLIEVGVCNEAPTHPAKKLTILSNGQGTREGYSPTIWNMPAADAVLYANAKPSQDLLCDFGFVGDALGPVERINELCLDLSKSTKIFGWGWSVAQCLGTLPEPMIPSLYASALASPCIPGDTDRPLNILVAGGYPLFANGFENMPASLPERGRKIKAMKSAILAQHTYFDRAIELCANLGLAADAILKAKEKYV